MGSGREEVGADATEWLAGYEVESSHAACLLSLPPPQKVSWEFSPQPPPHPKGISGLRFYGLKSQETAKFWSRVIYKPGMLGEGAGSFK